MMKKLSLVLISFIILFSTVDVFARRGCCSWHGGVTSSCRNGKIVCQDGTTSPSCGCDGSSSSSNSYTAPTYVYGCTDSNALNYNSSATKDDGSCIIKVPGCMNKEAVNYNSEVNVSDGSCQFEKTNTTDTKIKYKTKYVYSKTKKKGTVKRKGKNGIKRTTEKVITDEQGNIIKTEVIETKIIKQKVNKLVYTNKKSKK